MRLQSDAVLGKNVAPVESPGDWKAVGQPKEANHEKMHILSPLNGHIRASTSIK